jgi:SAM-dependent methyltransferase
MKVTDERFDPSQVGRIKYEHVHRYTLAHRFVAGKDVLDIASGEGYGCALLSTAASSVVGVDIDDEAVRHAAAAYSDRPNVKFRTGSCAAIPLPDDSVDVVTSFETIEHHDEHEPMMREIKRVLRPGGTLVLSSPNRAAYSDADGFTNPFHVRELYQDELEVLLRAHFARVSFYGQQVAAGSFVYPMAHGGVADGGGFEALVAGDSTTPARAGLGRFALEPLFFLAVCSNEPQSPSPPPRVTSVLLDDGQDLVDFLQRELTRIHTEHLNLLTNVAGLEGHHVDTERLLETTAGQLLETQAALDETRARNAEHVRALEETIARMEASPFWRLRGRVLKLLGKGEAA